MKKLITNFNNGFSFRTDDIRWFGDGFTEALNAFMSSFGATAPLSYKLSGCVVTVATNTYTTTAGWIVLNGEVLQVDAHSVTVSTFHSAKWDVAVTYDAAGDKLDDLGATHQTYQVRKGVLVDVVMSFPPTHMSYNAKYLQDIIASYTVLPAEEDWHIVGGTGEPAFESSWVNFGSTDPVLKFKKDAYGWVHIEGTVKTGTVGVRIFTLPAGYIPATYKRFLILVQDAAYVLKGCELHITDAGFVILNSSDSSDNRRVSLTGLMFKID